jgi:hypothetical protein
MWFRCTCKARSIDFSIHLLKRRRRRRRRKEKKKKKKNSGLEDMSVLGNV